MRAKVFYLKTVIDEENRQLEAHNSTQAKKSLETYSFEIFILRTFSVFWEKHMT